MISFSQFQERWADWKSKKILIGLSGGVDSDVLLRLFVETGFDVIALHANYQLRGKESDLDEQFVIELCKQLKVELHVKKVDTKALLEKDGGNLQEVARSIRYSFYQEFLEKTPNSILAIGHHQDDQIETFFLNIARKSGLRGMSCMLEEDGNKIRPLLSFSKQEIIDFAKENGWEWREDQSNLSLKYRRNALRNKFIPEMIEGVSNLKESVLLLIAKFQDELRNSKENIQSLFVSVQSTGLLSDVDFSSLNENEQVELLFQLGLDSVDIHSFYKLIHSQKGKFILQNNTYRIYREKAGFSFEKYFKFPDFQIAVEKIDFLPSTFSKDELYFDATKIKGEISLRKWKVGDRISPIGLKGSKLISDVLHDAKLYAIEKNNWSVLVDEEGVLVCPFISISREKIATKESEKMICVKIGRGIGS